MIRIAKLDRRRFLQASALMVGGVAAAGLGLGFASPGSKAATADSGARITPFLLIGEDGQITLLNPYAEMGQGINTGIAQVVGDELGAGLDLFHVVHAPPGDDYKLLFGGKRRFTASSLSMRSSYMAMRKVGATARAMLIEAAAQEWNVDGSSLDTVDGAVIDGPAGKSLGFGALAVAAAAIEPPVEPALRAAKSLIGKPLPRTDIPAKTNGQAIFGLDVRLEGMLYGAIRHNPVYGSTIKGIDHAAARALPGVAGVFPLDTGVAVLADSFWRAKTAAEVLSISYDEGANANFSSAGMIKAQRARLDEPGIEVEAAGDAITAIGASEAPMEAIYEAPFLAHATMEPMNCTAHVEAGRCRIWAPNQAVDWVLGVAMQITGLPAEAVEIETPYLGGGFGRRVVMDFVAEAVLLSKLSGKAVKLVWTREEDTQHDHYRPTAAVKLRATLTDNGVPDALHITAVGDGPIRRLVDRSMQSNEVDESVVEGLIEMPYAIANHKTDYVYEPIPAPIGFWRSVGHSMNAFFYESFVDELATAAKTEPLAYRKQLLANNPHYLATLSKAAELADYRAGIYEVDSKPRAMGVALHESFGSIVAEVAEISLANGETTVHNVWAAIDVGTVVNPAIVKAQVESAIAFGLSAALFEEVVIENGRAQAANFDTYPILPPDRMPKVQVAVLASGRPMGGVGEPGTPPVAPAITNAIAKLTGQRIRRLPLSLYDLAAA